MRYENRYAIVGKDGFLDGEVPTLYKTFEDAQRVCDSLDDSECFVDVVYDVMVTDESERMREVLDALRTAKKMLDGDVTPNEEIVRTAIETTLKMVELVLTNLETASKTGGVERMATVTQSQLKEICERAAAKVPRFNGLIVWAGFDKDQLQSIRWWRTTMSLHILVPRAIKDAGAKAVEEYVDVAFSKAQGEDAHPSRDALRQIEKSCTKDANREIWMASMGFDADCIDWDLTDAARMAADDPVWAERLIVVMPDTVKDPQNSLLYLTIFAEDDEQVIKGLAELSIGTDILTGAVVGEVARMAYSMNGHAPFFGTGKEARAYALAHPESMCDVDWQGSKAGVIEIRFDGTAVGIILLPPEGRADFCAYWAPEDSDSAYPLSNDGSYDPDDIFQICFEPKIFLRPRYLQMSREFNDFGGREIGFENEERAYRWFFNMADVGIEAGVVNADGKEIGFLTKLPMGSDGRSEKTVLITEKKCREVFPTGRVGKPFNRDTYLRSIENGDNRAVSVMRVSDSDYLLKISKKDAFKKKLDDVDAIIANGKGVERMYDVERGIHFKPRRDMGRLPGSETPAIKEEPVVVALSAKNIQGCQIVYGILLTKGRMNYNSIGSLVDHTTNWVKFHVNILKGLGLIESEKMGPYVQSPVECYALADAPLPEGWTVEEIISRANALQPVDREKASRDDSFGADIIEIFSKDPVVLESAVPAWEGFRQDLIALDCRNQPEIKKIVKDLIRLSERRLSNISYQCPVCGGKVTKTKTGVKCAGKCKISIDAPDSKTAMEYLALIGKGKRGVVE